MDVAGTSYEQVFAVGVGEHAGWNDYENNQPAGFLPPSIKYRTNSTDTRTIAAGGASRSGGVATYTTDRVLAWNGASWSVWQLLGGWPAASTVDGLSWVGNPGRVPSTLKVNKSAVPGKLDLLLPREFRNLANVRDITRNRAALVTRRQHVIPHLWLRVPSRWADTLRR